MRERFVTDYALPEYDAAVLTQSKAMAAYFEAVVSKAGRDQAKPAANWLMGDVDAISIRPGQPRASRLQLTAEQFVRLRFLSLFVLPEAIAALGVVAWWRRRRAPGR